MYKAAKILFHFYRLCESHTDFTVMSVYSTYYLGTGIFFDTSVSSEQVFAIGDVKHELEKDLRPESFQKNLLITEKTTF